jgi:hypothetical protein
LFIGIFNCPSTLDSFQSGLRGEPFFEKGILGNPKISLHPTLHTPTVIVSVNFPFVLMVAAPPDSLGFEFGFGHRSYQSFACNSGRVLHGHSQACHFPLEDAQNGHHGKSGNRIPGCHPLTVS